MTGDFFLTYGVIILIACAMTFLQQAFRGER